tara:strand:+ start:2828 stop:3787 length:960 start_codon:yes stop_codon:yes gene_type:complete
MVGGNGDRILVTGALGQIGTDLVQSLREMYGSDMVVASDIKSKPNHPCISTGPYIDLDVLDKERIFRVVNEQNIDVIYHLAAILSARGEENPELCELINVEGTRNIFDAGREFGLRIFAPSSIAVFGPDTPRKAPQVTSLNPTTKYGQTKVDCEILGMIYYQKYGVDIRGLRYPGLISWKSQVSGGTTDYAVDIFHAALSKESTYDCFLARDTRLPMMYMDDAIRATISLMNAPIDSLGSARCGYNISGLSFTPEELVSEINEKLPNFICEYAPDIRQKYADSWPESIDDEVAKNDWKWESRFSLEAIVNEMISNLKED